MYISLLLATIVALTVPHFIFTQEGPEQQIIPSTKTASEETLSNQTKDTTEQTNQKKTTQISDSTIEMKYQPKPDAIQEEIAVTPPAQEKPSVEKDVEKPISTEKEKGTLKKTESIVEKPLPSQDEIVIPDEKTEKEKRVGIDTVSLDSPQGNWLFKRIWWERAEERYERIRLMVDTIWNSRTEFFIKRNNLDRNVLDPFYITIGVDRSELKSRLTQLITLFEKSKESDDVLTSQERMLYETISAEEDALKQLERDLETTIALDHRVDDALQTLMEQINRVREFESQAWKNFKEIAHTLNDVKARELYYIIEGASRNIKNISVYLERDFTHYFNTLINDTGKHIGRVQEQIEKLKEKGVYLDRQMETTTSTSSDQEEEQEESEDVTPKKKLGWIEWITSGIKNAFSAIFSIIRKPYDMIFGK